MSTMLPWAALATAIAAFLLREGTHATAPSPGEPTPFWRSVSAHRPAWIALALLGVVALIAGWRMDAQFAGAWGGAMGVAAGCVLAAVAHMGGAARPSTGALTAAPLALGVAGIALTAFAAPAARESMAFGMVLGTAGGAWLLGSGAWATLAAVVAATVACANTLGAAGHGDNAASTGDALGLVAAVAAVLASGAAELVRRQQGREHIAAGAPVVGMALLFALGAVFLANRFLFLGDVGTLAASAIGAGLVVHWLTADGEDGTGLKFILSAVVWVGLATIAFGLLRGYGMAIGCLAAASLLVAAGNTRGLLGIGPALALVAYRVFRETHSGVSRAFDIGQHYAILGILLGILLPLLFVAWSHGRPAASARMAAAAWLGVFVLAGLTFASAVFLGAKGVVGLIVGLGLAPIVEGLRGSARLQTLTLGAAASAALILGFGWLGSSLDLARDEKLPLLAWIVGATVVVAALMAGLAPARTEESK